MTPMERIRKLMESGSFRFTKSLGQNFLTDDNILEKLVWAAGISKEDAVIEIGPGAGTVTEKLLQAAGPVLAVEIDKALIPFLKETLGDYSNLTLWHEDVLKAPLLEWIQTHSPGKPVKVVGNLPYYVTTPIIMKLLEDGLPIHTMVFMVQKEVALRMAASPGTKDYSALSVAVQVYCQVEKAFDVSANVFIPKPKVDSAVVQLRRHETPPAEIEDPKLFFTLVKAAFGQRRKTLSNALSTLRPKEEKPQIIKLLREANIDPVRRGETLNIQEFANITHLWKKTFPYNTMEPDKK